MHHTGVETYGGFLDLLVHMSDHTDVVHSCAPVLEHVRDHLSAAADHLSADHLRCKCTQVVCTCAHAQQTEEGGRVHLNRTHENFTLVIFAYHA